MEITLVQAEVVISKSNVAHNRNQFIEYLHHTELYSMRCAACESIGWPKWKCEKSLLSYFSNRENVEYLRKR